MNKDVRRVETELAATDLEALRRFTSPTISNAIETLNVRSWGEGYTDSSIRCMLPEMGPMVAFARTAVIMSGQPAAPRRLVDRRDYWEYLRRGPRPSVIVMQDLTQPPAGAYWGEVNGNIHRALGCCGLITSGTIRDLDELRELGLHAFASGVSVSHAYAHLEDFDRTVRVGGLLVRPGDLIHADQHGCVVVPKEVVREIPAAAEKIERSERTIIDLCRSSDFSIDAIDPLVSKKY